MKYAVGVVALLALAVLVLHLLGRPMPREHRASRSRRIAAPAPVIFKAITDADAFPQWRSELKAVAKLAEVGGRRRYRETSGQGALTFEVTEETPNTRLVITIVDEGQPFGGRWTVELRASGEDPDTEVTITEDGFVNPPIFRFLSRYVFGQTATMEVYLKNLEKRFATSAG